MSLWIDWIDHWKIRSASAFDFGDTRNKPILISCCPAWQHHVSFVLQPLQSNVHMAMVNGDPK